jgi:hypothetical protein
MSRKSLTLFYYTVLNHPQGLSFDTVDLVDQNNVKQGFLVTNRVIDNSYPPPPGYNFNPYIVTKSINLPIGVINFNYEVVNDLTVVVKPTYEAGFKNSIVTREIVGKTNNIVKGKLIIEYNL